MSWTFNQHLNDQGGQNLAAYAAELRRLFTQVPNDQVDDFMLAWREAMIDLGLTEDQIVEVQQTAMP